MIAQTRAVLDRYAAVGGTYAEVVYDGCGHTPHVQRPVRLAATLADLADRAR